MADGPAAEEADRRRPGGTVLEYIETHPGCTRKEIGAALCILEDTLKGYLVMLAPKLDEPKPDGPSRALTYRVVAP